MTQKGALIFLAIAYLITGAYWKALFLVLWGFLIVGSADNVVRPWVVGAREKQHPILIALAAIGGIYAFGPLGILLGPLLVSLVAALLKEIKQLIPLQRIEEGGTERHIKKVWKIKKIDTNSACHHLKNIA